MRGVVAVVRDGSFLGVIAEREEQAIKARTALAASAKWQAGPELPDPAHLYDELIALPVRGRVASLGVAAAAAALVYEILQNRLPGVDKAS